jgi:hypothetical protein
MQRFNAYPKASLLSLEQFKAEVEQRAREIFMKRQVTKAEGDTLSDWMMAEKQMRGKYHLSV